jgi:hypothetical protein
MRCAAPCAAPCHAPHAAHHRRVRILISPKPLPAAVRAPTHFDSHRTLSAADSPRIAKVPHSHPTSSPTPCRCRSPLTPTVVALTARPPRRRRRFRHQFLTSQSLTSQPLTSQSPTCQSMTSQSLTIPSLTSHSPTIPSLTSQTPLSAYSKYSPNTMATQKMLAFS